MNEVILPCGLCGQKKHSIFCELPQVQRDIINPEKKAQRYTRGQTIFFEGNPSFAVYCIHEGTVKLFKTGSNGDRQVVRVLGPGDIMGVRAIIANEYYTATAEALTNTTICVIPKDILFKLIDMSSDFSLNIMKKLAIELRHSEEKILSFALHSVKKRCANFLLSLIEPHHLDKKIKAIPVPPLLKIEIAQIIGVSPETLSRILKQFADQKIINHSRKEISIIDISRLKKIATK